MDPTKQVHPCFTPRLLKFDRAWESARRCRVRHRAAHCRETKVRRVLGCVKYSARLRVCAVDVKASQGAAVVPRPPASFLNPSKKVLYRGNFFAYPIGNTPAVDLFEGLSSPSSALLLGCGDVRNLLETCRKSTTKEQLSFALNDIDVNVIARDGLLLTIADQIDATNVDDVDFLWGVWYNLALSQEHFSRLHSIIGEILDCKGRGKPWLKIEGTDWENVEKVYRCWFVGSSSLPSVRAVERARQECMLEQINRDRSPVKYDWSTVVESMQDPSIASLKLAAAAKEFSTYLDKGSVARDESGGDNGFPNVTLLDPALREWRNHWGPTPFAAYRRIMNEKDLSEAGGVVKLCQRRLREWVAALQGRTRQESPTVDISLHCSDALEFCLGGSGSFDVIDTSNIADYVGLLNLVVCAGARLTSKPASRLYTSTLTWAHTTSSLAEYIRKALHFDPKYAPTILGLRLLTETELGKAWVDGMDFALGHKERCLEWSPVSIPSVPITVDDEVLEGCIQSDKQCPHQSDACAIGVELGNLLKACCLLPFGQFLTERSFFRLASPRTLALILTSMGSRCHLKTSGAPPMDGFTKWCTEYCVSFSLESEKAARLMDPSRGGLVELQGRLHQDPIVASMPALYYIVRLGLVHRSMWDKPVDLELLNSALVTDAEAKHSPRMLLVHVLDSASVDDDLNVRFLLPADHGLDPSEWEVVLLDLNRYLGVSVHSNASLKSMNESPFVAPVHLKNKGDLQEGAESQGLGISNLVEHEDQFVANLGCNPDVDLATFFIECDQQKRAIGASISVRLGFRSNPDQSIRVVFPSPIVVHKSELKGKASDHSLVCTFPKSSAWPSDLDSGWERLDISSLPRYNDLGRLVMKLKKMFSMQELMYALSENHGMQSGDPFYDLRCTIQIVYENLLKDNQRVHFLFESLEHACMGEAEPFIILAVTDAVRCMDRDIPTLLVSYIDHDEVDAQKKLGGFNERKFASALFSVLEDVGLRREGIIKVGKEEVDLLKRMLASNSAKLKPSMSQVEHSTGECSFWKPSFITPLYPDNMKTGTVGSKELNEKVADMSLPEALQGVKALQEMVARNKGAMGASVSVPNPSSGGFSSGPPNAQSGKRKKGKGKKRKK